MYICTKCVANVEPCLMTHLKGSSEEFEVLLTKDSDKEVQKNAIN